MVNFTQITVKDIAREVKDNCLLGIPADYSGVPMSVTLERQNNQQVYQVSNYL